MTLAQPPIRVCDSWSHQLEAYHFAYNRPATMLAMGMGCVDCHTEFLSPTGWKRIDAWNGERVAQFNPESRTAEFVNPTQYVKLPCEKMLHFKHVRGLDQMLSSEHRVLTYDHKESPRVFTASEIAERRKGTAHSRFLAAFKLLSEGEGLPLTDTQIQLVVAVAADGHFPCKSNRCVMRIKKQRKIERLRALLAAENIDFHLNKKEDGFHCFSFNAPMRAKTFDARFWKANWQQRVIFADEASRWDGSRSEDHGPAFFSTDKASADFIQYCFASTGRRASLNHVTRPGRKSTDYTVHAVGTGRSSNYVNFALKNGNVTEVRSPDGFKYCFEVPSSFLVFRRNGCVFTTGNTGKSKVAIDLLTNWGCSNMLIISPTSVRDVWRRELEKWSPGRFSTLILAKGTAAKKAGLVEQHIAKCIIRDRPSVVVINYESAWRERLAEQFLSHAWGCVVLDESHRVKANDSKISRFVWKLGRQSHRRLCLTGTPMPHGPLDVFGQYRFLDPSIYGTSWWQFRDRYAVRGNPTIPQMITEYKNLDDLTNKFGSIAYQVGNEVLDLPAEMHETRVFELTPERRRLYLDLENEFMAEIGDGVVTAANALVRSIRLRQLVSGFLVEDDTQIVHRVHDGKAALLADLLGDLGEPAVVFAEFRYDLETIERTAKQLGLRYGEVSGRQNDLTNTAEMPADIDVMGVQYQSGGVGIDLTRARYGIYYSPTYSLGNYQQSLARIRRPGQTRPVTYYHLVCARTIDETVYKALEKKADIVRAIVAVSKARQMFRTGADTESLTDVIADMLDRINALEGIG